MPGRAIGSSPGAGAAECKVRLYTSGRGAATSGRLIRDSRLIEPVERAPYAARAAVHDVRVNHRRGDVRMPEQLPHCANVLRRLQQLEVRWAVPLAAISAYG